MEFQLIDDGTLDTVVGWECPHCQQAHEERCGQEFAATYRDPTTGQLDLDALMSTIDDLYCGACDREWPTQQDLDQHKSALAYIEYRLNYALNSLRRGMDAEDVIEARAETNAARDSINEALGYLKGYFKGELI